MSTEKNNKIKELRDKYESKIVLFLGIVLVSAISFQLGILQGQKWQQDPLVIEKVPDDKVFAVKGVLGDSAENIFLNKESTVDRNKNIAVKSSVECVFVGSKNSNKYHKSDCRWSDQIKSENRICFKDTGDAKNKGYIPASCMK